jgi:hypothetical protein
MKHDSFGQGVLTTMSSLSYAAELGGASNPLKTTSRQDTSSLLRSIEHCGLLAIAENKVLL